MGRARLLAGLMLALSAATDAQVNYSGEVVDEAGRPVAGATIQVAGTSWQTQSAADGSFSLTPTGTQPQPWPKAIGFPARFFLLDGRRLSVPEAEGVYVRAARPLPKGAAAAYVLTVTLAGFPQVSYTQEQATARRLVLKVYKPLDAAAVQYEAKKACLDTLNRCRAQLRLPPLVWSKALEQFADSGAKYDSERNSPHAHFTAFVRNAEPADAENEVPGWPLRDFKTTVKVVNDGTEMMWDERLLPDIEDQGHYLNIKGDHHAVGCGVFVTPAGNVWVTQDFK